MPGFKDLFSKQSGSYSRYRPSYPDSLFEFLSRENGSHKLAWDCGTGNGQAALSLADYYERVYATDPSAEQISRAQQHPAISYKVEKAETVSLDNQSVDLITVAQAIHWFDFDAFYAEAKRVLKPGGLIAAWAYGLPVISEEIDVLVKEFHDVTVGDFWQHENRLIEQEYKTIPFPFELITSPDFYMHKELSFEEFLGLLHSWSAVQKYTDTYGSNPLDNFAALLQPLWNNTQHCKWKLILKAGRNT